MKSTKKNQTDFEVRGVKSVLISRALQFLDMIQNGYADFGKIKGQKAPEEFSQSGSIALGSTMHVLDKFDPELKKSFSTALTEKISPEISALTTWFLRITIFGSIGGIFCLLGLEFLRLFGIIPTVIAFPIMITGFIVIIILVVLVSIYAFMNAEKGPPQGVLDAIAEPQVRFEAERAFDRIIELFKEESSKPLRVLIIGEYDAFEYTEEVYITSRHLELRLAILYPESNSD